MRMKVDKQGKKLTIGLLGELDHHAAAMLREMTDAEIAGDAPEQLVIDFSGVDFMDSSGFGFVMGRYKRMQQIGGKVVVTGACGQVRRMLELSGAGRYVTIQ